MIKCTHKCARICQKIHARAHGAELDFLSFLTGVTSFIVGLAKTIVGLAAVGCIFLLIRLLPRRIRGFVSAIATSLLFFALFKNMVQQFAFLAIKTSILYIALIDITALTVLFGIYFATYCGCIFSKVTRSTRTFTPPRKWSEVQYLSRHDDIVASGSYLRISPVILQ